MDALSRRHVEARLTTALRQHADAVAEVRRHLRQLEDAEYSSAAWRNLAATATEGSLAVGRVDAYLAALAADDNTQQEKS
jgi:hypothetical protein